MSDLRALLTTDADKPQKALDSTGKFMLCASNGGKVLQDFYSVPVESLPDRFSMFGRAEELTVRGVRWGWA